MASLLPEIEGWIKAAGALVAVLMALLVPVRSWMVEDRHYRAQTLQALASAPRDTLTGLSMPSAALADSLALSAVAEGLDRVGRALERLLDAEADRDRSRLTRALELFLEQQAGR